MPSAVLQSPQIISLQGSVLRVAHPNLERNLRTTLVSESSAAATSLTVADNNDFYDPDFPTANLAGYWAFDEGTGATANDTSGNANNGTITGAIYGAGVSDTSLDFDGVNDLVTVTDAAAIQNIWDGGGAVSVWINPDSDGETDAGRIINKDNGADVNGWYITVLGEVAGFMQVRLQQNFTVTDGQWRTGAVVPINAWSHIVIVYNSDSVDNDPVIYLNGVNQTVTEFGTPVGTRDSDVGENLIIGNIAATTRTFDGQIDEARLYSATISAPQVLALYHIKRFLIGEAADARSEVSNSNGGAARGTAVTTPSSTVFAHEINTPLTRIQERAIRIYGAATDGGAGTLIASVDAIDHLTSPVANAVMIQWDKLYTEYDLRSTDTTYAFYYAILTDDRTDSSASVYVPAAGFASNRVINIIDAALDEANVTVDGEKITYRMLLSWANDWQEAVKRYVTPEGIKKDWTFEYVTDNTTIVLTENENEYSLAGLTPDLKYTLSHEAILNVRISFSEPLQYVDLDQMDKDMKNIIRGTLNGATVVGATSITLTSSVEFTETGSVLVGPDTLTYTANNETTGVLSGIPAAGAGSITAITATGGAVWQGTSAGTPSKYTIRSNRLVFNIPIETDSVGYPVRIKYIGELARFTSLSNSVSVIPNDHGKYYIASRIEWRKGNTAESERLMAMFEKRLLQEAIKDGLPMLEAQTYYEFDGGTDGGLVGELS